MNLNAYYWFFPKALDNPTCDKIINHCSKIKLQKGLVGEQKETDPKNLKNKKYLKKLKNTRDSNIVFVNDQWIYDIINPYVNLANKNSGWNFEINWNESVQFTKYSKKQFYNWHIDSFISPYVVPKDKNIDGKIRKLSTVIALSDPKEYVGGKFEFQIYDPLANKIKTFECKEIKEKGSLIVFPSFLRHRVNKVTKGTRYSLVNWSLGYPFK
jgi:PKHD-type hydroxylase